MSDLDANGFPIIPDNPLKNAEMSEEGNYNCIDGIINNVPLKPSILEQLQQSKLNNANGDCFPQKGRER